VKAEMMILMNMVESGNGMDDRGVMALRFRCLCWCNTAQCLRPGPASKKSVE
jgi:hypothetical protein